MKETKNANYWDMTEETRAKKLAEAKCRYGKPFVTEVKVQRNTEPSFVLREIERRSEEAQLKQVFLSAASKRGRVSSGTPLVAVCAQEAVALEQERLRITTGSVENREVKKTSLSKRLGIPDLERVISHFQLAHLR